MEDLRTLNKLKSPKRPASPSSPEHLPATPAESPAQRFEARIEDGKLYYDKRWYHKSQAIYLESKDNQKLSCVISSVGANEIWVRKTSDSTKMRIYLGQLQRGLFVIRRRSAAWLSTVLYFPWLSFRNGVLFCFLLNRKFLTWDLLLGLGKWRTLWWILQGTFVASHFRLCFILSCLDFFQPSVAMKLYRNTGCLIDFFIFLLCVCAFKAWFEFEGTSLFINYL